MLLSRMSQLESSFVPLSKVLIEAQDARQERSVMTDSVTTQAEQLNQLAHRMSKVENYAARDTSGALLAFRIGELRRKVSLGHAFGPEIIALNALTEKGSFALNGPLQAAVSWLSQHKTGVATREALRDQFNDLIPALIRSNAGQLDDSWWQRAYNSGRSLIMIRKTEVTPEINLPGEKLSEKNMDHIIVKTQRVLDRLDLEAALSLLKPLTGPSQKLLEIWTLQAETTLRADNTLNHIESLTTAFYLEPANTSPNDDIPQPEQTEQEKYGPEKSGPYYRQNPTGAGPVRSGSRAVPVETPDGPQPEIVGNLDSASGNHSAGGQHA